MAGSSPENELEELGSRLMAARDRLRSMPAGPPERLGPPDEKTGEQWDRGNVLGHVAEMLPYWSRRIRESLKGAPLGRPPGETERARGIESGRLLREEELRHRIERGVEEALGLLSELRQADLDREIPHRAEGSLTVRKALDRYLVGHLEEHLGQLAALN